jgi:long-chain acyl-CoA synthetase
MIRSEVIQPVSDLVDAQARARPDAPALRDAEGWVTYGELARRTAGLAGALRDRGVRPGDRVAIYMSNSTSWVEATLATVRAGAVSVGIPAQATPDDAAFMLGDCGAALVFTDAEHHDATREAVAGLTQGGETAVLTADEHGFSAAASGVSPGALAGAGRDLDAPAWMLYTSGTTGRPKGVLLTQRSMLWVAAAGWLPFFEWGPTDHVLCPLPLTHSYPLDATLATLAVGAVQHLQAGFSPTATMAILNEHDVTILLGVPTVFSYLLQEHEGGRTAYTRRTLRMGVSAGAVLAADIGERATAMLGAPILDAYGATEASTAITMCGVRGSAPRGSCGVSLPGMAVRVVDPQTTADREAGEEGEVIARGPGIMLGYHDRPRETADALRDGWYHTGDLGRLDAHGHLSITGRLKDIIIRGGENIAPAEIESVVIEHAAVGDCAVVGVEHAALGEVPVLAIVAASPAAGDPGELADVIAAYCRERLPRYKRPDRIVVVDAVPRTGSGKVMRHRLREAIEVTAG